MGNKNFLKLFKYYWGKIENKIYFLKSLNGRNKSKPKKKINYYNLSFFKYKLYKKIHKTNIPSPVSAVSSSLVQILALQDNSGSPIFQPKNIDL